MAGPRNLEKENRIVNETPSWSQTLVLEMCVQSRYRTMWPDFLCFVGELGELQQSTALVRIQVECQNGPHPSIGHYIH